MDVDSSITHTDLNGRSGGGGGGGGGFEMCVLVSVEELFAVVRRCLFASSSVCVKVKPPDVEDTTEVGKRTELFGPSGTLLGIATAVAQNSHRSWVSEQQRRAALLLFSRCSTRTSGCELWHTRMHSHMTRVCVCVCVYVAVSDVHACRRRRHRCRSAQ